MIAFYLQEELDAAIAKERLRIAHLVRSTPPTDPDLQRDQNEWLARRIAQGDYPRELVV